jgi:hypothetical protein
MNVALWAADYRWPNAGTKKIRSKSDRQAYAVQGRSETWVGVRPRQRRRTGPRDSGTKASKDAQGESRSYTTCDMTEVFSNGSNCR